MGSEGPTTRCKFRCNSVETFGQTVPVKVKLSAVYPDPEKDGYKHDEDHAFFNATPQGSLELLIQNPYGAELFQPQKNYYLDISAAD
jgi:hypothetical protein